MRKDSSRPPRTEPLQEALFLRAILEATSDGILVVAYRKGRVQEFLLANRRFYELFGLTPEEIVGKKAVAVTNLLRKRFKHFDRVCARLEAWQREPDSTSEHVEEIVYPQERTLRHFCGPIRDGEGAIVGRICCFRDETDLHRAVSTLRASEARYRDLFKRSGDVVFTTDVEGRFTSVSEASRQVSGYAPEEMVGRSFAPMIHPDDAPRVADWVGRILAGESVTTEFRAFRKDGSIYHACIQNAPLIEDGKVVGVFAIGRDVTRQRQLEAELNQAQKMESLGGLAGGLAHEFNNLLVSIMGFTSLIKSETDPGDPNYGLLEMIEREGQRGSALVKRLLDFARPSPPRLTSVDPVRVLAEVARICEGSFGRHFQIVQDWPEGASCTVEGDPSQLSQVFLNLALNARDAMPEGGTIRLAFRTEVLDGATCQTRPPLKPGLHAVVQVSDSGIGMDAATQERIFEPFFSTKGTEKGSGLGLAVVYRILQEHGGFVATASAPGKGSTFTVYMPCQAG